MNSNIQRDSNLNRCRVQTRTRHETGEGACGSPIRRKMLPVRGSSARNCRREPLGSRTNNRPDGRHGFTLVEMMVVISILGVLLTLTGMTFHLLLRTEKLVSQSFITERTLSRLAVQFRDDCHQSSVGTISTDEDGSGQQLELIRSDENVVRYTTSARGFVRVLIEKEQILAREDFLLPECQLSILAGSGGNASMLRTLNVKRPGAAIARKEHTPVVLRSLRIDAHLRPSASKESPADVGKPQTGSTEVSP